MTEEPVFELKNVGYSYMDGLTALDDISLQVMPGQRVVILGVNGSGKSTLIKIMDGLYFPTTGECKAFGVPLTERQFRDEEFAFSFRRKVGLLFQDPDVQLFSPTVWNEVAFAPLQLGLPEDEIKQRVENALETMGIWHLRERAPYQLSEGEKKKVALASLLSLDPQIWLMDEPTANLDPRTQGWVIDFLLSLADRGKTLVLAIHELEVAQIVAQKIYVLGEDHRMAAQGGPDEILGDDDLLTQANLMHIHRHFHGGDAHRHPHVHKHDHHG